MDGEWIMIIVLALLLPGMVLLFCLFPELMEDNRYPPNSYTGKRGGKYYLKKSRKTRETYRKYY